MSPGLASPSSPSEQSISPLSGAVSGGHLGTIQHYNEEPMHASGFDKLVPLWSISRLSYVCILYELHID